jgi:hypothetical protein
MQLSTERSPPSSRIYASSYISRVSDTASTTQSQIIHKVMSVCPSNSMNTEFGKRKVAKSGGTVIQAAHIADSKVEGELPSAFRTQPDSTPHVIYILTTTAKSEGRFFVN